MRRYVQEGVKREAEAYAEGVTVALMAVAALEAESWSDGQRRKIARARAQDLVAFFLDWFGAGMFSFFTKEPVRSAHWSHS